MFRIDAKSALTLLGCGEKRTARGLDSFGFSLFFYFFKLVMLWPFILVPFNHCIINFYGVFYHKNQYPFIPLAFLISFPHQIKRVLLQCEPQEMQSRMNGILMNSSHFGYTGSNPCGSYYKYGSFWIQKSSLRSRLNFMFHRTVRKIRSVRSRNNSHSFVTFILDRFICFDFCFFAWNQTNMKIWK